MECVRHFPSPILVLVGERISVSHQRVKLLVKKYEPRFIVALWLAWGDEAIGTYTVNSAFNESVCLLSWRYCYVWSAEKLFAWPLPGVNQSRKYLRTFLCHRISFCPFSSSPLLPSGVDSALRSCVTKREKWLEILITVIWIWYHVFVEQPGLRKTGTAASLKQE